jgi:ABC-type cobalt transport system substrate-binding protein
MPSLWNQPASDSAGTRNSEGDSLRMIPLWSVILSIIVFLGTMYFFNMPGYYGGGPQDAARRATANPTQQPVQQPRRRPNAEAGRLMFSYTTAAALASYILLVGYVSRDVKRRNMPAALWILIVVVMPGGIGAVVYFLLRQPIMTRCPNCTTELAATVHFCPQCQFQVAPVCGRCFRGVQITDVYCAQCGHDVAEDHAPARLRAYSDS